MLWHIHLQTQNVETAGFKRECTPTAVQRSGLQRDSSFTRCCSFHAIGLYAQRHVQLGEYSKAPCNRLRGLWASASL